MKYCPYCDENQIEHEEEACQICMDLVEPQGELQFNEDKQEREYTEDLYQLSYIDGEEEDDYDPEDLDSQNL